MIAPKERPILFSAPMVGAILDGRKTQTRRIINRVNGIGIVTEFQRSNTPGYDWCMRDNRMHWHELTNAELLEGCPYGKPGDRLYVKESAWMWCERKRNGKTKTGKQKWLYEPQREAPIVYCADHPNKPPVNIAHEETGNEFCWRKKIGRFLPRWASRISLEVTTKSVERLQDISEEDAIAEGLKAITKDGKTIKYGIPDRDGYPGNDDMGWNWCDWNTSPVLAYKRLWESINEGSWDLNPFVWVVEFKTLQIARVAE